MLTQDLLYIFAVVSLEQKIQTSRLCIRRWSGYKFVEVPPFPGGSPQLEVPELPGGNPLLPGQFPGRRSIFKQPTKCLKNGHYTAQIGLIFLGASRQINNKAFCACRGVNRDARRPTCRDVRRGRSSTACGAFLRTQYVEK